MWTRHEMERGTLWHRREGGVIESVFRGTMGDKSAVILTRELDRAFADVGWCAAFHDWDLVAHHSIGLRRAWMKWALSPAAKAARFTQFRLGQAHLLKLAVRVAHVAFAPQPFIVHPTRAAYFAARAEHLSEPDPIDELVEMQRTIVD